MELFGIEHRWFRIGLVLLAALAAMGCQASPWAQDEPALSDSVWGSGRSRSLVFDSSALRGLRDASRKHSDVTGPPWYASRNDARLTTFAGFRGSTFDRLVNITYDRQTLSGGHLRDHYHNTTYRQTVSQTVR